MPTLPRPRYLVWLSASERAHIVVDTRKGDAVVGSFYWDTATYFGQSGIEAQQLADKLNYDDARPMPQIDTAALARQLIDDLNEYDARGLPCDERYEAKSVQIRSLGYDIGPDAAGALCLYDSTTQRPLSSAVCDEPETCADCGATIDGTYVDLDSGIVCAACYGANHAPDDPTPAQEAQRDAENAADMLDFLRSSMLPNETPDTPALTSCRIALPGGWWAVVDERGSFCGVVTEAPMA